LILISARKSNVFISEPVNLFATIWCRNLYFWTNEIYRGKGCGSEKNERCTNEMDSSENKIFLENEQKTNKNERFNIIQTILNKTFSFTEPTNFSKEIKKTAQTIFKNKILKKNYSFLLNEHFYWTNDFIER